MVALIFVELVRAEREARLWRSTVRQGSALRGRHRKARGFPHCVGQSRDAVWNEL